MKKLFLIILLFGSCAGALAQVSTQQRVIAVNSTPTPGTCRANSLYKLIVAPFTLWTGGAAGSCTIVGAGTVTGSGATGQLAKWSSSTALGNATAGTDYTRPSDIQATSYNTCQDAGANDTYACSLSPAIASYSTGQVIWFKANTANTGAATINLNSLGAKAIKKNKDSDLADNDIKAGQWVSAQYDGTNFQLLSPVSNTSGGSATKYYRATLTQEGTNPPVATVTFNDLGTITFGRDEEGVYSAMSSGLFTAGKTTVFITPTSVLTRASRADANAILIQTGGGDDNMTETSFMIVVDP
jgi:hypothetical protein